MTNLRLCVVPAKLYRPPEAMTPHPSSSQQGDETEEIDLGWVKEEDSAWRKKRQGKKAQESVSDEVSEELLEAQQEEAKVSRSAHFHSPATCPFNSLTILRFTETH